MYRFYNNNALGLFENDCTVRAISTATNNSWDDTYEHLSNIARLNGTMMDDKDFIIDYKPEVEYQLIETEKGLQAIDVIPVKQRELSII